MGGFPSGQRGQTVNLLHLASVVRIHHHPFAGWSSLEARRAHNPEVDGSNPLGVTNADVAQLAEQLICNQQVIGSSPIIGFMDL